MDYYKIKDELILWIKNWFSKNGNGSKAIVPLSGGKDSTIVAALCAEAIGKDMVIGIGIPDAGQSLNGADEIAEYLGIKFITFPIGELTAAIHNGFNFYCDGIEMSNQTEQNIPPRLRTTIAFAIAQSVNGRVCCCDNASENYIGYSTLFGDDAGSFAPLGNLTVTEVRGIGHALGLPNGWVEKIPDDGLPHSSSDEEKFGFSYEVLDKYIRTGECEDPEVKAKIDRMHEASQFKRDLLHIPAYSLWSGKIDEDLKFD